MTNRQKLANVIKMLFNFPEITDEEFEELLDEIMEDPEVKRQLPVIYMLADMLDNV